MPQAKKSGGFNLPLMVVAFLAIAGFLYWLSVTSEPTEMAVAEEDPQAQLGDAVGVSAVELAGGAGEFAGQRIRVPNVQVMESMGPDAFWFALPPVDDEDEGALYLVRIDRDFVEEDVLTGDVISVSGTVGAMSEDVVRAWEDEGVFTEEGQRPAVEALDTYLEADQIEVHSGGAPEVDEGDDDSGGEG